MVERAPFQNYDEFDRYQNYYEWKIKSGKKDHEDIVVAGASKPKRARVSSATVIRYKAAGSNWLLRKGLWK